MIKILMIIGGILLYFVVGSCFYALAKAMGITQAGGNDISGRYNYYRTPRYFNTLLLLFFPFTILLCIATACGRVVDIIFDRVKEKQFAKKYCDVTKEEYEEWCEYGYSNSYRERHNLSILIGDRSKNPSYRGYYNSSALSNYYNNVEDRAMQHLKWRMMYEM